MQEANGRNESRERRALVEFQADFARERSWDVNTAREVFRLPKAVQHATYNDMMTKTALIPYCEPLWAKCLFWYLERGGDVP